MPAPYTDRQAELDMADFAADYLGVNISAWSEDDRAKLGDTLLKEATKCMFACEAK